VQATTEAELNMVAGLTGEAAAHRTLLDRLSGHLRAYFKGRLARIGRTGTEAEDLCPVWVRRTRIVFHPACRGGLSESGRILKGKHPAVLIVGESFPIAGPGNYGAQGLFC
jgi:hypothetical protein